MSDRFVSTVSRFDRRLYDAVKSLLIGPWSNSVPNWLGILRPETFWKPCSVGGKVGLDLRFAIVDKRARAPVAAAGRIERCDILGSELKRRFVREDSSRGRLIIAAFRRRNQRIRMTKMSKMIAVPPTLPVTAPATKPGAGVLLEPLPPEPAEPLPVGEAPDVPEPEPAPPSGPRPDAGELDDEIEEDNVEVVKVVTDELDDRKPRSDPLPFRKAVGRVTFAELLVAISMLLLTVVLSKVDEPMKMLVLDFSDLRSVVLTIERN